MATTKAIGNKTRVYWHIKSKTKPYVNEERHGIITDRTKNHYIVRNEATGELETIPRYKVKRAMNQVAKKYPKANIFSRIESSIKDYFKNLFKL